MSNRDACARNVEQVMEIIGVFDWILDPDVKGALDRDRPLWMQLNSPPEGWNPIGEDPTQR